MTRLPSPAQAAAPAQSKKELKRSLIRFFCALGIFVLLVCFLFSAGAYAAKFNISMDSGTDQGNSMGPLQVLILFAAIALAPTMLLMMTSFTRIIIVLSLLRNALGLQTTPPNQVLIGIALALTLFVMAPTLSEVNTKAVEPYTAGKITQSQALENAKKPLKVFMLKQTGVKELNMFLDLSGQKREIKKVEPNELLSLGFRVIMPAFVTSELKRAFTIGFLLFIPFMIIDMVVSSVLMSMGMVMLPPSMISLPFKLMLFVVVDGWGLIFDSLIKSFR